MKTETVHAQNAPAAVPAPQQPISRAAPTTSSLLAFTTFKSNPVCTATAGDTDLLPVPEMVVRPSLPTSAAAVQEEAPSARRKIVRAVRRKTTGGTTTSPFGSAFFNLDASSGSGKSSMGEFIFGAVREGAPSPKASSLWLKDALKDLAEAYGVASNDVAPFKVPSNEKIKLSENVLLNRATAAHPVAPSPEHTSFWTDEDLKALEDAYESPISCDEDIDIDNAPDLPSSDKVNILDEVIPTAVAAEHSSKDVTMTTMVDYGNIFRQIKDLGITIADFVPALAQQTSAVAPLDIIDSSMEFGASSLDGYNSLLAREQEIDTFDSPASAMGLDSPGALVSVDTADHTSTRNAEASLAISKAPNVAAQEDDCMEEAPAQSSPMLSCKRVVPASAVPAPTASAQIAAKFDFSEQVGVDTEMKTPVEDLAQTEAQEAKIAAVVEGFKEDSEMDFGEHTEEGKERKKEAAAVSFQSFKLKVDIPCAQITYEQQQSPVERSPLPRLQLQAVSEAPLPMSPFQTSNNVLIASAEGSKPVFSAAGAKASLLSVISLGLLPFKLEEGLGGAAEVKEIERAEEFSPKTAALLDSLVDKIQALSLEDPMELLEVGDSAEEDVARVEEQSREPAAVQAAAAAAEFKPVLAPLSAPVVEEPEVEDVVQDLECDNGGCSPKTTLLSEFSLGSDDSIDSGTKIIVGADGAALEEEEGAKAAKFAAGPEEDIEEDSDANEEELMGGNEACEGETLETEAELAAEVADEEVVLVVVDDKEDDIHSAAAFITPSIPLDVVFAAPTCMAEAAVGGNELELLEVPAYGDDGAEEFDGGKSMEEDYFVAEEKLECVDEDAVGLDAEGLVEKKAATVEERNNECWPELAQPVDVVIQSKKGEQPLMEDMDVEAPGDDVEDALGAAAGLECDPVADSEAAHGQEEVPEQEAVEEIQSSEVEDVCEITSSQQEILEVCEEREEEEAEEVFSACGADTSAQMPAMPPHRDEYDEAEIPGGPSSDRILIEASVDDVKEVFVPVEEEKQQLEEDSAFPSSADGGLSQASIGIATASYRSPTLEPASANIVRVGSLQLLDYTAEGLSGRVIAMASEPAVHTALIKLSMPVAVAVGVVDDSELESMQPPKVLDIVEMMDMKWFAGEEKRYAGRSGTSGASCGTGRGTTATAASKECKKEKFGKKPGVWKRWAKKLKSCFP